MLNDGAIEYEDGTPVTEAQVGPFAFPVQKVHKIIVLDMRMANADRHTGNILMSRGEDEQIFLIQIDQGYCLLRVLKVLVLIGCIGHKLISHSTIE
ncbi:hypothetical protein FXO38_27011 [Capsicum annuum]|nr:hypothetical protein FXO37_31261 [Capsicum annuum]KAF3630683.1 hypothetical protein FXO38_27011 [Capsicum annuum]